MKLLLKVSVILSILVFDAVKSDDVEILYRRVAIEASEKIYDDTYTGSYYDVSIWRPVTLQSGFYALGDVAVATHGKPTFSAVMVKDISEDALKSPTGFNEVWNDKGSGGIQDVRIMSMTPPSGYVCLGHVAVIGYNNVPDKNVYRCVKEKYVTKGKYEFIWKDAGSQAYRDVSLWSNRVSEEDTYGIDANTFTSFSSHGGPSKEEKPYLLDGRTVVNDIDYVDTKLFPLTVYEIPDVEKIYYDAGTGASRSISVWRSKGPAKTFSLGDIAIPTHSNLEVGFVVKPHDEAIFSVPYDFQQIWNDAGSQGDWVGAFWKPFCKPGYRALGHVAMRNQTKPDAASVRCINETYTVPGKWELVWNDAGSGAYKDVSVYTAAAKDEGGQALKAMTSFKGHGDPDTTPYVLNASETDYIQGPPAIKFVLQDIHYHLDDYKVLDTQPASIARTTVANKGGHPATSSRTLTYQYQESYSWTHKAGGQFGVQLKLSAGVPFLAQNEVTVSASISYEHTWGSSETETFTDAVKVDITVQNCSTKAAEVTGFRYKMDVPYDATLVTYYADGTHGERDNYEGVFRGVQVNEVHIVYEPDIPIPDCKPKTES